MTKVEVRRRESQRKYSMIAYENKYFPMTMRVMGVNSSGSELTTF